MKKILCAALCLIVCLGVFASCGSAGPESLVAKMQKAIDNRDANLLLECYEPSVQELFKSFMGDNLDTLLEEFDNDEGAKVTLKLDKVEYTNSDKTTAKLTITAEGAGDEDARDLPVKLVDGEWYLDIGSMIGDFD